MAINIEWQVKPPVKGKETGMKEKIAFVIQNIPNLLF